MSERKTESTSGGKQPEEDVDKVASVPLSECSVSSPEVAGSSGATSAAASPSLPDEPGTSFGATASGGHLLLEAAADGADVPYVPEPVVLAGPVSVADKVLAYCGDVVDSYGVMLENILSKAVTMYLDLRKILGSADKTKMVARLQRTVTRKRYRRVWDIYRQQQIEDTDVVTKERKKIGDSLDKVIKGATQAAQVITVAMRSLNLTPEDFELTPTGQYVQKKRSARPVDSSSPEKERPVPAPAKYDRPVVKESDAFALLGEDGSEGARMLSSLLRSFTDLEHMMMSHAKHQVVFAVYDAEEDRSPRAATLMQLTSEDLLRYMRRLERLAVERQQRFPRHQLPRVPLADRIGTVPSPPPTPPIGVLRLQSPPPETSSSPSYSSPSPPHRSTFFTSPSTSSTTTSPSPLTSPLTSPETSGSSDPTTTTTPTRRGKRCDKSRRK